LFPADTKEEIPKPIELVNLMRAIPNAPDCEEKPYITLIGFKRGN